MFGQTLTSALELIPVELIELSEYSLVVFCGDSSSRILYLHSKYSHRINANLLHSNEERIHQYHYEYETFLF